MLTDFTRGRIVGMVEAGWSITAVSRYLHLSKSTVHRWWSRWKLYSSHQKKGISVPKPKLSLTFKSQNSKTTNCKRKTSYLSSFKTLPPLILASSQKRSLNEPVMSGHGHSHECGGHSHGDVSQVTDDRAHEFSLFQKIDLNNLQCLNESEEGSGRRVFKAWDRRLDDEWVESDCDAELLFNVPFTGVVKLKGIILAGEEGSSHPKDVSLYKNKPFMSFDDCRQTKPDQVVELSQDPNAVLEYRLQAAKFTSVSHLSIFITSNFSGSVEDSTKVLYIGLRGEYAEARRQEVLVTNYELRPNPADHKHSTMDNVFHEIS